MTTMEISPHARDVLGNKTIEYLERAYGFGKIPKAVRETVMQASQIYSTVTGGNAQLNARDVALCVLIAQLINPWTASTTEGVSEETQSTVDEDSLTIINPAKKRGRPPKKIEEENNG